jgi:hypothetical protein
MQRENIEWAQFRWNNTHDATLPRVLLIGDSIVVGYNEFVAKALEGKVNVAFYATSKCVGDPAIIKELTCALDNYDFRLIHFNNGLHGFTNTEEEYGKFLAKYTDKLEKLAPDSQLVWAMSTPITEVGNPAAMDVDKNDRVLERNRLAAEIMSQRGIPVNDLYSLVAERQSEFSSGDGYHYNEAGRKYLGEHVAEVISEILELND